MAANDSTPLGASDRPAAAKVSPESVALRAQPQPVTRLNRRSLAVMVGLLAFTAGWVAMGWTAVRLERPVVAAA